MATHLVSCGIDEQRAYEHFDAWSAEDTYFSVDERNSRPCAKPNFRLNVSGKIAQTLSWSDARLSPGLRES